MLPRGGFVQAPCSAWRHSLHFGREKRRPFTQKSGGCVRRSVLCQACLLRGGWCSFFCRVYCTCSVKWLMKLLYVPSWKMFEFGFFACVEVSAVASSGNCPPSRQTSNGRGSTRISIISMYLSRGYRIFTRSVTAFRCWSGLGWVGLAWLDR